MALRTSGPSEYRRVIVSSPQFSLFPLVINGFPVICQKLAFSPLSLYHWAFTKCLQFHFELVTTLNFNLLLFFLNLSLFTCKFLCNHYKGLAENNHNCGEKAIFPLKIPILSVEFKNFKNSTSKLF